MSIHYRSPATGLGAVPRAVVAIALLVFASGCAGQGSAASSSANVPIVIGTTESAISLQNHTGLALTSLTVTLVPVRGAAFSKVVGRMENLQREDVALNDLRTPDGASFNRMFAQPLSVRVVASDLTGRRYEVEAPWK